MIDPHEIDIAYTNGNWLTGVNSCSFRSRSLMHLLTHVQRQLQGKALLFVVDQKTNRRQHRCSIAISRGEREERCSTYFVRSASLAHAQLGSSPGMGSKVELPVIY